MTRDEAITALVEKWRESARKLRTPFPGLPKNEPTAVLLDSCAQELADTLSALGGRPETGWQPIATAPKDGTAILIWQPRTDFVRSVREWKNCDDSRYAVGYWRTWVGSWGNRNDADVEPTHWQPLPSPPLQEQP
jgi:hypothetical protein